MAMSRQKRVAAWLAGREADAPVHIREFIELMEALAPIPEATLRHLLRDSGAGLEPLVAGVDQETMEGLRASLLALAGEYERGSEETRRTARRIVITAKEHAKLAARNRRVAADKRELKEEMAAWMLTWLENPSIFPLWAAMRWKALDQQESY